MTRDGGRMADTTELLERESQLSELSGLLDSARSEHALLVLTWRDEADRRPRPRG